MLTLTKQIIIEDTTEIIGVTSINIESDVDTLTDNCIITVPQKYSIIKNKNLYYFNNKKSTISIGNSIKVYLGYNNDNNLIFDGFIESFNKENNKININCEDYMYKIKNDKRVQRSYKSITLDDMLFTTDKTIQSILTNSTPEKGTIVDFTFSKFRVANPLNPAEILNIIKEHYGFYVFFRDNKLYAGLKYPLSGSNTHTFYYPYNTAGNPIINNDLKKQYTDIDQLIVIYNSIQQSSTNVIKKYGIINNGVIEIGDVDDIKYKNNNYSERDNTITINMAGVDVTSINESIKNILQKNNTVGYSGSFSTFGQNVIKHGDIIDLYTINDDNTTLIKVSNYVDKVITTYNNNGYRQEITLGSSI